ncbi:plasmid mobilization relaxosome protein MobC, partial [Vibrio anguillarum]
ALHNQDWKPVDRVQIIAVLSSLQRELNIIRMENAKDDS